MKPAKSIILLIFTLFLQAVSLHGQSFTKQSGTPFPGIFDGSLEWGDFDNDGDLDLFLMGDSVGITIAKIYSNNGNGTFTERRDIELYGLSSGSAEWVDYDNDGYLDLFLSGVKGNNYQRILYRNEGGNGFALQTDIAIPGLGEGDVQWGDYDNDGDQDILMCGRSEDGGVITSIFQNNGANSFTEQAGIDLQRVYSGAVDWSDYDRDGDLDILLCGTRNFASEAYFVTLVYRNEGNNSFSEQSGFSLQGVQNGCAVWGDYDNDAYPDILLSGIPESGESISQLYHNNGGSSFSLQTEISLKGFSSGASEWGDYNNDGYLDILMSGAEHTGIYRNDGGNGFTELSDFEQENTFNSALAWGDYDNDGDLDFVISAYYGQSTELYQNNVIPKNSAPTSPGNLQALVKGSSVELSWDHASDAESPQEGLSYNLMIGTSANGTDICSPMADISTGYRRIVSSGDIRDKSWIIEDLAIGTYHWRVQTIDGAGAGSAFSVSGSFTVSDANSIAPTARQILLPDTPGTTLTVSETLAADSRQWKYSTRPGGPYEHMIPGATGITYEPIFSEFGSYYVVCVSERDGGAVCSNEVSIEVPFFTHQTEFPAWIGAEDISNWCDFDSDGDLDILLTHEFTSSVLRNDGDMGFSTITGVGLGGLMISNMTQCDYDNDGDLDILYAGKAGIGGSGCLTMIYLNNGDNSFTPQTELLLPGVSEASLLWEDMDGDGDPDILLSGVDISEQLICKLIRNDGDGLFTELNPDIVPFRGVMKAGDYDNDGFTDIVMSGTDYSGNIVAKVYRNKGDNSFEERKDIELGSVDGSVDWGDFDNDGDLDILLVGQETQQSGSLPIARVYQNRGNSVFTEMEDSGLFGVSWGALASWTDFDNDGDLDIFISGYHDVLAYISRFFVNTGDAFTEFIPIGIPGLRHGSGKLAWGDYDGDKDLDLFLLGYSYQEGSISRIYRNNSRSLNTAPEVPGNPVSKDFAGGARLSWDRSADAETPSEGLSYNVCISKSKGDADVLAPLSDLISGYRKISRMGNAYLRTEYTINGLEPGTYYWKVQSLDHCYQSSSFTAIDSFSVLLPFTENDIGLNDMEAVCTSPGDFNADGYMDILLSGDSAHSQPATKIYANVGESQFASIETGMTDLGDGKSTWWDYNNDGFLDVLVAGTSSGAGEGFGLKLYRNMGDGSFSLLTSFESIYYSRATWVTGDLNNDGLEDLFVIDGNGSHYATLFKNNGDETFTNLDQKIIPNFSIGAVALGDYDKDMDLDILIAGGESLSEGIISRVYRNEGDFLFTDIEADLPGFWESNVSWADYDGDGDLDILLAGTDEHYNKYTLLFRNDGDDVFVETPAQIRGARMGSLHWGDFDNDGDPDIIYAGNSGTYFTSIYQNDGNDRFTEVDFGHPLTHGTVSWYDFDNDRDLDILCSRGVYWNAGTGTFRNNGNRDNERPAVPTGLHADGSGYGAKFSWDASSDDHTPSQALSYNIRVGSHSGGQDLMAPKSHAVSGKLLLPSMGNCQLNTGWRIDSLAVGTYYWSVQAVDNTYVGGEWAPEQSFIITTVIADFESDTVCEGAATSFTDLSITSGDPISKREWDFGDGTTSSLQDPVHTYAEDGSYQVKLIVSNSLSSDTAVYSILVKSSPVFPVILTENYIAGGCPPEVPVILSVETVESGTLYQWMKGNVEIPGANSDSYTGFLEEGDYAVVASLDGCSAQSITQNLNYGDMPVKPEIYVAGPVLWYLACSNDSASDYRWYRNQRLIAGADEYIYVAGSQEGSFEVAIARGSNCFAYSDPVSIPLGTGIEKDIWEKLKIYPNPTPGRFSLEMDNPVMGELIIDIFSESGAQIINIKFQKETTHFKTEIDLSGQTPALYLINLMLEEYRTSRPLIVE